MSNPIERKCLDDLVIRYRVTRKAAVEAEEALFEYLWAPLLNFVRSRTDQQATDLAASAMAKFLGVIDEKSIHNSKALLFKITNHRIYQEWRRKRPDAVESSRLDEHERDRETVSNEVIFFEQEKTLRNFITENFSDLIEKLPERDRHIVGIWWFECLSEDAAADRAKVSLAEARRALKRFQERTLNWFIAMTGDG